jgi:N6-adenosine-specific RNA methylase IME4
VKYKTIVADPPWEYREGFATQRGSCTTEEVRRRWRENVTITHDAPIEYPTLSLDEIAALPVADLAEKDCRLFLWTTQRYLPASFAILDAWGFAYRQTLVWHKTSSFSPFGGSVAPNNAEFVFVAVKGKPPVVDRAKSCVVATPGFAGRRKQHGNGPIKHSQKPEAFLDLVEHVSPGPYVELFARRARFGWHYWGDESLGTAVLGGVA